MDLKEYNLSFKGYWLDNNRPELPDFSGSYLVYKCVYNQEANTVKLLELMYIGQAENIRDRIEKHEKRDVFLKECKNGETLCYSAAEVEKDSLDIVENALIFAQQPKLNDACKDKFNYDPAEFHLEGECSFMQYLNFRIN
ncbi:MAG: GIY-YIG nuclease family protein [Bacteroidales bacterium]|jgi:excinuclease UvrABC nuclease subunit|nr:GIY-YIG nuclease family protein [Bacteroidales bacterium]